MQDRPISHMWPWLSISIALTIIGICISEDPIILSADYVLPCYVFILLCFKTRFVKLHQLFRKDPFFGLLCLSVYQHADWSCTYALLLGCTTSQAKKLPTYSHGLLKKKPLLYFSPYSLFWSGFTKTTSGNSPCCWWRSFNALISSINAELWFSSWATKRKHL